jgi:Tol biopolymer transport system component
LADGSIAFARREEAPHQDSANLWKFGIDAESGSALGDLTRLTRLDLGQVAHVSATRDGKRLAFLHARRNDDVYLGDLAPDGSRLENTRRLTLDDRRDVPTVWSRDGRSVLFHSSRQGTIDVFRQGIDDKTAEVVISGPGTESDAVLSPDGSLLLYDSHPVGGAPGVERIIRVPVGGGAPELVAELSDMFYFLCPNVAESSCAVAQNDAGRTSFYALDPLKGKGRRIGSADSEIADWSLSSDGSRIAFVNAAGIQLMRVADGTVESLPATTQGVPRNIGWSADGRALFVASLAPTGWRLLRVGLDGRVNVLRQTEGRRFVFSIVPSPDGKHLAFGERTIDSNAWILDNF